MFFYTKLITALGYALLNSLWQMALTWLFFYYLLTDRNKRFTAAVRHNLILILCMVNTLWFVYDFVSISFRPSPAIFSGFQNTGLFNRWIRYFSVFYLLILFFRTLVSGFRLYRQKIRFKSLQRVSGHWQEFANRYSKLLGISKKVCLFFSDAVETAETSGFIKPIILMPLSLITNLSPLQLEAIIVHEILHIRRNDYLINLMMTAYRHIFFFNPFAHIFYQTLCHQRELACDDGVIEKNFSPQIYADALFRLEKCRHTSNTLTLAADGHSPWLLRERITRLLGEKPVNIKSRVRILPFITVILALCFLALTGHRAGAAEHDYHFEKNKIIPISFNIPDQEIRIVKVQVRQKKQIHARFGNQIESEREQPLQEMQVQKSAANSSPPELMQYARHREVRNFTNQHMVIDNAETPKSDILAPYIPEQCFEFIPEQQTVQSDTLNQIRMKDLIALTIIQKSVIRHQLKTAKSKIDAELKNIENRRKVYQQLNESNFKQLIKKLQEEIEQKKKEIDRIENQDQSLEEEIIHI